MAIVTSTDAVIPSLLKMLGIDDNELVKAVITIEVNSIVTVEALYNLDPETDDGGKLIVPQELKKYALSVEELPS
ncbi:MAG: hypothetical protein GY938_13625 [Ketobacter sp.]|nr:hypothetical protein [Ketobacter sp.]